MSPDLSPQMQLQRRRQQLLQALLELGDLRPGSLARVTAVRVSSIVTAPSPRLTQFLKLSWRARP